MSYPITLAENGDTSYFKRAPVEHWRSELDGENVDNVFNIAIVKFHIHCAKVIYGRCPELLHKTSKVGRFNALHHAAFRVEKPSMLKFVISVADKELHRMMDINKRTALQKSINESNLEAVELLVEADPGHLSFVDGNGLTPLLNALRVSHEKRDGHNSVKIRRLLLEKEPNACKIRTGERGWTALHQATSKRDRAAVEDIICLCPDSVHEVDKDGCSFLDTAIEFGHSEVVKNILRKKEIWDLILRGNNIQGITKLVNFLSDHGKEVLDVGNTLRDKKSRIPPKHLWLYRELVHQFGDIVDPSKCMEEGPTPMYEALGCLLDDVSEMVDVKPGNISNLEKISLEKISHWKKMASEYSDKGLKVSWFQELVARYGGWFAKTTQHLGPLNDEIATTTAKFEAKREELKIKYSECRDLQTKLRELQKQHDTYTHASNPISLILEIIRK